MSDRAQLLESLMIASSGSIRAFSKKCGVPQSTIMSILRRPESATIQNAIRIAHALGVGLEIFDAQSTKVVPSGDELQLIQAFRGTDDKTKKIILSAARTASDLSWDFNVDTLAANADNINAASRADTVKRAAVKAAEKYWSSDNDGDGKD